MRGRPRTFDRDQAVEQAMLKFWDHGYQRTSVATLTAQFGIKAPSFYAAFGSKEALFLEALELYRSSIGSRTLEALARPDGRQALAGILRQSILNATARSSGCLIILGGEVDPESPLAASAVASLQRSTMEAMRQRLQLALTDGDLQPQADPHALTEYLLTVLHGISLRARLGSSADDLQPVAQIALDALPWREPVMS